MKKEHVTIIKKAIREMTEMNNKEWKVDKDGKIYWDYISKDKPAFEIFVGHEHKDEDGTSTRVFAFDLTMDETFKYTYAGTDRLLCDYKTIEEAIYAVAQSVVRKARNTY